MKAGITAGWFRSFLCIYLLRLLDKICSLCAGYVKKNKRSLSVAFFRSNVL